MLHHVVVATNKMLTSDDINDPQTSESEIVLDKWYICSHCLIVLRLAVAVARALMDARAGGAAYQANSS